MSEQRNDVVDRVRNMLAFAVFGEGSAADGVRDLLAEIEGLRAELDEVAELNCAAVAENTELRSRLAAAERVCEAAEKWLRAGVGEPSYAASAVLETEFDAWRAVRDGA